MEELSKIKEIAVVNGFPLSVVENIVKEHSRKMKLRNLSMFYASTKKKAKLKPVKFEFAPPATNKIKLAYKKRNLFNIVCSTMKLKQLLGTPKDKQLSHEKSGIYKVTCKECGYMYLGRSKRQVMTRYKEH